MSKNKINVERFRIDVFIDNPPSKFIYIPEEQFEEYEEKEEVVLKHIKKKYKNYIKQKICDMIMDGELKIHLSCGDTDSFDLDSDDPNITFFDDLKL